jgi:hypothetical protein
MCLTSSTLKSTQVALRIAFGNHHLHSPHRERRALRRILRLLQQSPVREHVLRPLHVHIHGVTAGSGPNRGQSRPANHWVGGELHFARHVTVASSERRTGARASKGRRTGRGGG